MKRPEYIGYKMAVGTFLTLGFAAAATVAHAAPLPLPALVGVDANEIFAPPGFDSNDDAQVVLHGEYMNTCYKSALPEVDVDQDRLTITVTPKAYLRTGCWCAPVTVSFTQPVSLGVLKPGKYRVIELGARGTAYREASLSIAEPQTGAIDEFMYAPVKNALLSEGANGRELVLSGTFNSDCMEMQEIKALHRTANVIEVLPITSYKTGSTCNNANKRPFEARVKLPATEPGETLLHVRLLNGQALNLVEPL